jgi:hypothetical protein
MSKGNRNRSSRSQTTRLNQHQRQGKVFKPPMRTFPSKMVPWLRDTYPDMLWVCSLIAHHGSKPGMLLAANFIDCVEDVVNRGKDADAYDVIMITGALTTFDRVPKSGRPAVLRELRERGLFEDGFPWLLARGLQRYAGVPATWLIDGWIGHEQIVAASAPEEYLAHTTMEASHGQSSIATKAKALLLRAWLKHGKLHLPPEMGEEWASILPRYPDGISEEERRRFEPVIRATFMAFGAADGEGEQPPLGIEWAKAFWRQNWKLYDCSLPSDGNDEGTQDAESNARSIREIQKDWAAEVDATTERFFAAAQGADPDLYTPERNEVLTGLVFRLLRLASVMVQSPPLWTTEHGSGIMRSLVEGQIVLRWLLMQDSPELYERFKDYGRGRLKLLKLHLEEYRDSLEDAPSELDEQIDYLDALVNRDLMEEFQDISIEGSFAGVDTRKMAEQVDMLTDYRLVFAPASSSVHGEWAFLDQYILSSCANPLHRRHRIPDPTMHLHLGPDVVDLVLARLSGIVGDYEAAFGATKTQPDDAED